MGASSSAIFLGGGGGRSAVFTLIEGDWIWGAGVG